MLAEPTSASLLTSSYLHISQSYYKTISNLYPDCHSDEEAGGKCWACCVRDARGAVAYRV